MDLQPNIPEDKSIAFFIRSGITTYMRKGFAALEVCDEHQQAWREGAKFQDEGGLACRPCVETARPINPNFCPNCHGDRFKTVRKGQLYACRSLLFSNFGHTTIGCGWMGNTLLSLKKGGN